MLMEFTDIQRNQLWEIAHQCPFSGGPAVYRARAMYELIDPAIIYDDEATCLVQGIYRNIEQESRSVINSFSLHPNPASDNVTISYLVDGERKYKLKITDLKGQKVKILDLPEHQNTFNFDIADLNDGFYIILVTEGKQVIGTGKLNVIHQ